MDKVKFKLTVPDGFKCKCGSDSYIIEEISENDGHQNEHELKFYINCTMICSKCNSIASEILRNSLFGRKNY